MAKQKKKMLEKPKIKESQQVKEFQNIVSLFDEETLKSIGHRAKENYRHDLYTIGPLITERKEWNKQFDLFFETKNYPWPNASNITIPVITTACINTQARLMSLVEGRQPVLAATVGLSVEDIEKALRVSRHMQWQLQKGIPEFMSGHDIAMLMLPRDGSVFKKSFYDSLKGRIVSDYVKADNIVINYFTKRMEDCRRWSEKTYFTTSELLEKGEQGVFLNVDKIAKPGDIQQHVVRNENEEYKDEANKISQSTPDETTPRLIIEQHTYLDMSDSGLEEPVIIIFDEEDETVLSITRRTHKKVEGTIEHLTAYSFLPSDSSIYGFGFGRLLMPINKSMNALANQTIDAGHLSNVGTGFKSRRSRLRGGKIALQIGRLIDVDVTGSDDIRKTIMPWRFDPPSGVLLQLLEFLNDSAKNLTTVTELFTGQVPKSDTSATASNNAVEQGAKLFTGIQKRVYRSLTQEYAKIYTLNTIFLDKTEYFAINAKSNNPADIQAFNVSTTDYDGTMDIYPTADPSIVSQSEIINKGAIVYETIINNPLLAQDPDALVIANKERLTPLEINPQTVETLGGLIQKNFAAQIQQQIQQARQEGQQEGYNQGVQDAGNRINDQLGGR